MILHCFAISFRPSGPCESGPRASQFLPLDVNAILPALSYSVEVHFLPPPADSTTEQRRPNYPAVSSFSGMIAPMGARASSFSVIGCLSITMPPQSKYSGARMLSGVGGGGDERGSTGGTVSSEFFRIDFALVAEGSHHKRPFGVGFQPVSIDQQGG